MAVELQVRPRQGGKTTHCVEWLLEDLKNRVIVVLDARRREDIMQRVADATDTRPDAWDRHVINYTRDQDALQGRNTKNVYIDQADHLLSALMRGHRLEGVTWDA